MNQFDIKIIINDQEITTHSQEEETQIRKKKNSIKNVIVKEKVVLKLIYQDQDLQIVII